MKYTQNCVRETVGHGIVDNEFYIGVCLIRSKVTIEVVLVLFVCTQNVHNILIAK